MIAWHDENYDDNDTTNDYIWTWWSSDDECLLKQWFRITADTRQIVLNTARWGYQHHCATLHSSEHTICATGPYYLPHVCAIVCMTQAIGWAFRARAPWADRHPRRCGTDKRPVCRYPLQALFQWPPNLTIIIFFATQLHNVFQQVSVWTWRRKACMIYTMPKE